MEERAVIASINVSNGGVPKKPVGQAVVGPLGIAGDYQANTQSHGGTERAVCLYAWEAIEALRAEGHPIVSGSTGENITIRGIDWRTVQPGMRFKLGPSVVVEITRFTTPCNKIQGSFAAGDFNRIHDNLHPGWSRVYARIVTGGVIRLDDAIEILDGE